MHISLVSISCLMLNKPETLVDYIVTTVDTRDKLMEQSDTYLEIRQIVIAVSEIRIQMCQFNMKC